VVQALQAAMAQQLTALLAVAVAQVLILLSVAHLLLTLVAVEVLVASNTLLVKVQQV
jgi:hypothetical protein